MAAVSNAEFAKTLQMPAEWQEKAAAFADAKGLSLAARDVVAEWKDGWTGRDGKRRPPQLVLIVTADALMAIALRDGGRSFAPVLTEFTTDGQVWVQAWLQKEPPAACRVRFEVQGIDAAVIVVHTWAEYTQGKPSATQLKMPATMLAKATRSMGVRQIAPGAVGGLHSEEEAHAIENAADTEVAEVAEIVDTVTPEAEKSAKGTRKSTAELQASRKEELVRVGKALRSECGDDAANHLGRAIKARGCDPDKLTADDLKVLLGVAKLAREEAQKKEAAPAAEPAPGEPELDQAEGADDPAHPDDMTMEEVAEHFDGTFVI